MKTLTYEEVLDKIENQMRFGHLPGVEVSGKMLEQLGNPEKDMALIHIAGTNGKGSVSAFLCAILRESGLKIGLFVSPHLVDFEERIQVNGKMISKADVTRLGNRLLTEDYEVTPTMFDYCLGMGCLYFKEQQCDVIILETGLGGTLDSTNAVGIPVVSVITKIGYDHIDILGDTLTKIAGEKAGIIKPGTRLVMESQEEEANEVLLSVAKKKKVKTCRQVDVSQIVDKEFDGRWQRFSYRDYDKLKIGLFGDHQYENAAVAILAAEEFFEEQGMEMGQAKQVIRDGLKKALWQGRMEILCEKPYFLIDGAHNSNGVEALAESLKKMYPGERFHFIMGVMADKDYDKMIECLVPLALDFKTVTVESNRALQAEELARCIQKKGVLAKSVSKLSDCILPHTLSREHRTVAFGSLYFIGEIKKMWD